MLGLVVGGMFALVFGLFPVDNEWVLELEVSVYGLT